MKVKINLLKEEANEIIALCVKELKTETPNVYVLKTIKEEFEKIIECIEQKGQIRVINSRKQLFSSKIISDSADFNFNKELFLKVADFSNKCEKISAKYLMILFDY